MEIVLLRHGKPGVSLSGWINASRFKEMVQAYADSDICDIPPGKIAESFRSHTVICSDLPRSAASAQKLEVRSVYLSDKLFTETAIPHFDKGKIKLPVFIWLVFYRVIWLLGFKKNGESFKAAKDRAIIAAEKLITLAGEKEKVILVGHGLMNRLVAKQLLKNNWVGPTSPGRRHWEYGIYEYK